jgi:hypothetical protein
MACPLPLPARQPSANKLMPSAASVDHRRELALIRIAATSGRGYPGQPRCWSRNAFTSAAVRGPCVA